MKEKYVISAELDLPNDQLSGIIDDTKLETFRENLDADLRAMGKDTIWIPSSTIQKGIKAFTGATSLPIASLDDRYAESGIPKLGISRTVDSNLMDDGYAPRNGYPSLDKQLAKAAKLGNELVIVDDVIYSGEMILQLNEWLIPLGSRIGAVVCGIAISEGAEKLSAEGIDVNAVELFDAVEDELCERDFAFIPGSGRRIKNIDTNALYFDSTYGKPESWASIPESSVDDFCKASLLRNIGLVSNTAKTWPFLGYPPERATLIEQLNTRLGEL